jgi:uncharacterized protein YdaL
MGELYATGVGVLASHFGGWRATPVSAYRAGAMRAYELVIYVGSTFDQPLPEAFTSDVLAETTPTVWIGDNVWELARRAPDFQARFGFTPGAFDAGPFRGVRYKGVDLAREADATEGVLAYAALDTSITEVLASAVRADGTSIPWALRTRRFTYIGEPALAFVTPGDRMLALSDLLFDDLAPATKPRHRALVRIEDVSPRSSPAALREIADRLSTRGVPFSIALIPVFEAPDERLRLRDAPEIRDALLYMLARGGSLVLHGYTHQYRSVPNPYSGTSGTDFEFYRAHLAEGDRLVLDGPVEEDSEAWAADRVARALDETAQAGLPRPRIFEYPHYAGSPADSRAIARVLGVAFQRESFFAGTLAGTKEDTRRSLGLLFPFVVSDVYGWRVVPENLGNYAPLAGPAQSGQSAAAIVERARALYVVRDGVAGFFFHPVFDPAILLGIVDDLEGAGYTFVSAESLATEPL